MLLNQHHSIIYIHSSIKTVIINSLNIYYPGYCGFDPEIINKDHADLIDNFMIDKNGAQYILKNK